MGSGDFDKILKDEIKMWKPSEGDNRFRIVPPTWERPEHYAYDIYVHYGVGPDRQTYLDLHKMKGLPDPITEERARAVKDGDEEYAKELRTTRRALIYLVDRNAPREGVQAWAMPQGMDSDLMNLAIDKETGEVLSIDDPDEGYDVEFHKSGTGIKTKYEALSIARRSSPLGDDRWLQYAVDRPLPDQLVFFDYDHIAQAFGGGMSNKPSSRDRDRDDGRPSGRERVREDDAPARGRERESSRDRRADPAEPTWDSVHQMTFAEMEDLIKDERLPINPDESKDDDDLADWICEELKLDKPAPREERSGGRQRVRADEDGADDKLAEMRRRRGD